jgi:hypothetical protein
MSKTNFPQTFTEHMRRTSHLSFFLQEAKRRSQETAAWQRLLPDALRDRVYMSRQGDCLTLIADNNAVAQMLRFHKPRLLAASGCSRLRIQIETELLPPSIARKVERKPSPVSAQLLHAAAEDVTHKPLKEALKRLASHLGNENNDL